MTSPSSHDAASEDSLVGVLKESYKKFLQSTDNMLPARVVSYDRTTNRAVVKPLIQMLTTLGERISREVVSSIPVFQNGGGGFIISFNLVAGDLGWIKASDRDISLFLQNYNETEPNTYRLHSFSDGVFFPDVMTGYDISAGDEAKLVIQNLDGSVKITLSNSAINMKANLVEIQAPVVSIVGALTVTGQITSNTDVVAGTISLKTHKTTGVTPGVGISGVPTP